MVRGRKQRVQKTNGATTTSSPIKKLPPNNLLVNALFDAEDSTFSSPKRKESKIDGILMDAATKPLHNGKVKPFRPATRSTRKINEYFARLPANGLIRVQNGHISNSEDSCDSVDDHNEIKIVTAENVSPNVSECDLLVQSKQKTNNNNISNNNNGPALKPEAQIANTNLFLQEPVLKLEFDKEGAVENKIAPTTTTTIKTSFLSTEITTKFQTLPPTEYINKVLNVNGSQDDDVNPMSKEFNGFLVNSDSNSSDSGVVINCTDSDNGIESLIKTPLHIAGKRRKPITPHRMILCTSPVKSSNAISVHHRQTAEIIKPAINKNRTKTKVPSINDDVIQQDHDYDYKKPQEPKTLKSSTPAESNKKVTEFFPVRRSVRKTKKEVQAERMRNIEDAIRHQCEDGLAVRVFPNKGRGIVTTRSFQRGEFVVEYTGDLISMAEANDREAKYSADDNTGCYMYYFKHNEQQYCIDATAETGKLGRLVNHSRTGNLLTKTVMIGKRPHLVLIAKDDLAAGVELTYDYGDRSREALQHHPWLAF